MTYFSFFPESFKQRNLKVAIVFNYEDFRFEVWLAGYNKQVQQAYWRLFKESDWNNYPVAPSVKGVDYIIRSTLVKNPEFDDMNELTAQIEKGTLSFIHNIEAFLSRQPYGN